MKTKRRSNAVGDPMLVVLPDETDPRFEETNEGGMAFYFVVGQDRRCVCVPGSDPFLPAPDVVVEGTWGPRAVDAVLLIGSTGRSLWNELTEMYFSPSWDDLNDGGKELYKRLCSLYGEVEIVTLLDT